MGNNPQNNPKTKNNKLLVNDLPTGQYITVPGTPVKPYTHPEDNLPDPPQAKAVLGMFFNGKSGPGISILWERGEWQTSILEEGILGEAGEGGTVDTNKTIGVDWGGGGERRRFPEEHCKKEIK